MPSYFIFIYIKMTYRYLDYRKLDGRDKIVLNHSISLLITRKLLEQFCIWFIYIIFFN